MLTEVTKVCPEDNILQPYQTFWWLNSPRIRQLLQTFHLLG
jgi:hypothetical protein